MMQSFNPPVTNAAAKLSRVHFITPLMVVQLQQTPSNWGIKALKPSNI